MFATVSTKRGTGTNQLYTFDSKGNGKDAVKFLAENFSIHFPKIGSWAENWLESKTDDRREQVNKRLRANIRAFITANVNDFHEGILLSKENAEKFLAFAKNTYVNVKDVSTLTGRNISDKEDTKEIEQFCANVRATLGAKVSNANAAK